METDAQQVPPEYEEILLYCEGKLLYCDLATKQTGQGGCGVSLTGDTQSHLDTILCHVVRVRPLLSLPI